MHHPPTPFCSRPRRQAPDRRLTASLVRRAWLALLAVWLAAAALPLQAAQALAGPASGAGWAPGENLTWSIQRVEATHSEAYLGERNLRLDAQGHPHIVYGGDALYYAWHDGTSWHVETVVGPAKWIAPGSLSLDAGGNPHVSYYDGVAGALKYAHRTVVGWQVETVDSYTSSSSLALDGAGRPHIAYFDATSYLLKYARWTGSTWQIETVARRQRCRRRRAFGT